MSKHKDNKEQIPEDLRAASLVEQAPTEEEPTLFQLGHYQILRSVGKGGMGEVFYAYDPICGRKIALKRIRSDLNEVKKLYRRFLREARITSQLIHPAIIPIYEIHIEKELIYYTMPYVEGDTLKQILKTTRQQEKRGQHLHHLGGSIQALSRVFLSICQAVAYAHSNRVLHRDLKPENIIIGKYGQVVILDWGLAKLIDVPSDPSLSGEYPQPKDHPQLTKIGKVVGTVHYMAPERVLGNPASLQTEIYSLGVILYQILTLHHPFRRPSLEEFRKTMHRERWLEPAEIAPYREVPPVLANIARKCLQPDPKRRYQSVDKLIYDLENYLEGRSEWFPLKELDINNPTHWKFQENVFLAEHVMITRNPELANWVTLMIAKTSVPNNAKVELKVRIGDISHGIGVLMNVPEISKRKHLNNGYCLWIASSLGGATTLLRSAVEVIYAPEIVLEPNKWYKISIEKIDNNIHFTLDNTLQFSYISYLPLPGTHIGLMMRDGDFEIKEFSVYSGSHTIKVDCLAVPDAFLANKDYEKALIEYRRIGSSFPGRTEGREAMFRAGVTLLEQARPTTDKKEQELLMDRALQEFSLLHDTAGAPLEYLGKALVYEEINLYDEEIKCFELALRRYRTHPLLSVLGEQISYRLHESTRQNRIAAYHFILLVLKHLPRIAKNSSVQRLFSSLQRHWEPLSFLERDADVKHNFEIQVAFWLASPWAISESIDTLIKLKHTPLSALGNGLYCLIELGSRELARQKIRQFKEKKPKEAQAHKDLIQLIDEDQLTTTLSLVGNKITIPAMRTIQRLLELALDKKNTTFVEQTAEKLSELDLSPTQRLQVDCIQIWACFLTKNWQRAGELLHKYSLEKLTSDDSLLHFLYGCWLIVTEGKEISDIHFSSNLDIPFPRTWNLAGHWILGKISHKKGRWQQQAFLWEKRQLFRQLTLYHHCLGKEDDAEEYARLAAEQKIDVKED